MHAISTWPFRYLAHVLADVRRTLKSGLADRAGSAAIGLFLLPWAALAILKPDFAWFQSLVEIVLFVFLFWWMSRSGASAQGPIRHPRMESIIAITFVLIWVSYRTGICTKAFPFLPLDFNCFNNYQFEIGPKVFESFVIPFVLLMLLRYSPEEQGISWSWRAWWVSLPLLFGAITFGLYSHRWDVLEFSGGVANFLLGAGIPEEFLFRAFLLTRLEAWWRSPGWALFGSSAIFGLSHLPNDYLVFTRHDWRETWTTLLTFQMGFGFAFGFAYQRIRNIAPLALLHAMVDAF